MVSKSRIRGAIIDQYFGPLADADMFCFSWCFLCHSFVRSTLLQSPPNKAAVKCPSVCTYMRMYVRAYIRPSTKTFFNFSEIWHVGKGR